MDLQQLPYHLHSATRAQQVRLPVAFLKQSARRQQYIARHDDVSGSMRWKHAKRDVRLPFHSSAPCVWQRRSIFWPRINTRAHYPTEHHIETSIAVLALCRLAIVVARSALVVRRAL